MNSNVQEETFKEIRKTEGKAKNKIDKVVIETSIKGLVFRNEVYINGNLVDAKEVSCLDIASSEEKESIFKERYFSSHEKFEDLYLAEKVFIKVLSDEGEYIEDEEEQCIVTTFVYENIVKHEVFVGLNKLDVVENIVEKELSDDKTSFKNKYTQYHKEICGQYIKVRTFPTNTFLNPTLKKFPFYSTKPMYSLYMLLLTVVFVLWILSFIVCGKAIKGIVKGIAGPNAAKVVKDLQKSMCGKSNTAEDIDPNETLDEKDIISMYGTKYLILPEHVKFKDTKEIKTLYFKNNLQTDIIVKLRTRLITDFKNPLVTPDMIVNLLTKMTLHIKGGGIGSFDFTIEEEFLENSKLKGRSFDGNLIFDVIDIKEKKNEPMAVEFSFTGEDLSDKKAE